MTWLGKLIGFIIGALIAGPVGALLGLLFGHFIDQAKRTPQFDPHNQAAAQKVFFEALFLIMGHIAKADGHVSVEDIQMARTIMTKIGLNENQKRQAIYLFQQGKLPQFNLNSTLQKLKSQCEKNRNLLRLFLEIEVQAAYASGTASAEQQSILKIICKTLNLSSLNFIYLNTLYSRRTQSSQGNHGYAPRTYSSMDECYAILNIKASASDAEVKRAYRTLISAHHPDKLIAKGLPDSMIKVATEKTQAIQKAYDTLRTHRGMK